MSTWVSVGGKWKPAKEHAVLAHLSGTSNEVYDGPDRSALLQLWEESGKPTDPDKAMTFLGQDFKTDPEFIARVRQLGFSSVDEYLKIIGYDYDKEIKKMEEKAVTVKSHQVVKRARAEEILGGGVETGTGKIIETGAIGDVALPAKP